VVTDDYGFGSIDETFSAGIQLNSSSWTNTVCIPHPRKAVPKDNPDAPASPIWVGEEVFSIEEEQAQAGSSGKIDASDASFYV